MALTFVDSIVMADGRWLMADGRRPIALDPSSLPYRQIALPLFFAVSIRIHYPLSYISVDLLLSR
jgi:hypothetical protein